MMHIHFWEFLFDFVGVFVVGVLFAWLIFRRFMPVQKFVFRPEVPQIQETKPVDDHAVLVNQFDALCKEYALKVKLPPIILSPLKFAEHLLLFMLGEIVNADSKVGEQKIEFKRQKAALIQEHEEALQQVKNNLSSKDEQLLLLQGKLDQVITQEQMQEFLNEFREVVDDTFASSESTEEDKLKYLALLRCDIENPEKQSLLENFATMIAKLLKLLYEDRKLLREQIRNKQLENEALRNRVTLFESELHKLIGKPQDLSLDSACSFDRIMSLLKQLLSDESKIGEDQVLEDFQDFTGSEPVKADDTEAAVNSLLPDIQFEDLPAEIVSETVANKEPQTYFEAPEITWNSLEEMNEQITAFYEDLSLEHVPNPIVFASPLPSRSGQAVAVAHQADSKKVVESKVRLWDSISVDTRFTTGVKRALDLSLCVKPTFLAYDAAFDSAWELLSLRSSEFLEGFEFNRSKKMVRQIIDSEEYCAAISSEFVVACLLGISLEHSSGVFKSNASLRKALAVYGSWQLTNIIFDVSQCFTVAGFELLSLLANIPRYDFWQTAKEEQFWQHMAIHVRFPKEWGNLFSQLKNQTSNKLEASRQNRAVLDFINQVFSSLIRSDVKSLNAENLESEEFVMIKALVMLELEVGK